MIAVGGQSEDVFDKLLVEEGERASRECAIEMRSS